MARIPCACAALFDEASELPAGAQPGKSGDTSGAPTAQGAKPRFDWMEGTPAVPPRDDGTAPHLRKLEELGLEGVIDAHSHWFPEKVLQKIWEYFDRHYWPIAYRTGSRQRLDWVRRNGVRRFTTLNYAHRPGMAAWLNEWTAEWAADVNDAVPCGTFYPEPEVGAYVRRSIEDYGFRGFKLHLRVSDLDPTEHSLYPAFEQVEQAGLPVVIHSGSAPEPGRFTVPVYIRGLLERFPRLKVVVAHMGAWEWEDYMALAERHEHCYLDTTMVFVGFGACGLYPETLLPRLEAISHKVLFGSDFPNIPYPLSHAVNGVVALPLSREARRRILYENAARLFGLNGA